VEGGAAGAYKLRTGPMFPGIPRSTGAAPPTGLTTATLGFTGTNDGGTAMPPTTPLLRTPFEGAPYMVRSGRRTAAGLAARLAAVGFMPSALEGLLAVLWDLAALGCVGSTALALPALPLYVRAAERAARDIRSGAGAFVYGVDATPTGAYLSAPALEISAMGRLVADVPRNAAGG
jgi:hypothetical protein